MVSFSSILPSLFAYLPSGLYFQTPGRLSSVLLVSPESTTWGYFGSLYSSSMLSSPSLSYNSVNNLLKGWPSLKESSSFLGKIKLRPLWPSSTSLGVWLSILSFRRYIAPFGIITSYPSSLEPKSFTGSPSEIPVEAWALFDGTVTATPKEIIVPITQGPKYLPILRNAYFLYLLIFLLKLLIN